MLAGLVLIAVAELAFGISGRIVRGSGSGLRPIGENSALGSPPRIAYQSDFWGGI